MSGKKMSGSIAILLQLIRRDRNITQNIPASKLSGSGGGGIGGRGREKELLPSSPPPPSQFPPPSARAFLQATKERDRTPLNHCFAQVHLFLKMSYLFCISHVRL